MFLPTWFAASLLPRREFGSGCQGHGSICAHSAGLIRVLPDSAAGKIVAVPDRRLQPGGGRGFTLIELLVVLVVLTLGTLIVLPSMKEFTARNRLLSVQTDFMSALNLARSEAVRRGVPVLFLAASGGVTGNAYANGWRLVPDLNGNGSVDSGESELRAATALPSDIKLDGDATLVYAASGFLTPASSHSYTLCPASGSQQGLQITVTPSGLADVVAITTCS